MKYSVSKKNYSLDIEASENSAFFSGGRFYDIEIEQSPLFKAVIEDISDKSEKNITSQSSWEKVVCENGRFVFTNPDGLGDISFVVTAKDDEKGISWYIEIVNKSEKYTVASVDYPVPVVTAEQFNAFIPGESGREIKNVGNREFEYADSYPHHHASIQYFAYYGDRGGIYLGIHDENAGMKEFFFKSEGKKQADLKIQYYAIGAGRPKNCSKLGGYIRWEAFEGDWYDATMLYADFVYKYATWLPEIDENGRPDTIDKLKEIPYWVVDYVPNSEEQRDVRPKVLGAVSHLYHKDYWFDAPIQLQKRLGTPIGFHIYNWHRNPFNINYPHFTPKDEYFRGLKELKGKNINVMPYINGVSWENRDFEEGFEVNFDNTGKYGAALDKFGKPITVSYPQQKLSGNDTSLSPMCPSFEGWHKIVDGLARKLENEMDVDGVYFDEIAAHNPHPCRSEDHDHIPGGGSYWSEGYNQLMEEVKKQKPDNVFYVSESSGEPYMKSFDGYLTWLWRKPDDVPAFPAIYAGYIVMLGRFTDGADKADDNVFKTNIAKGLLYGQQLGWLFAEIVYNEYRMSFLEKFVAMRYKHWRTFSSSKMLRPPKVVGGGEGILAGGWKRRNNSEIYVFVTNTADTEGEYVIEFNNDEYGADISKLPENSTVCGNKVTLKGKINALDCLDIRLDVAK